MSPQLANAVTRADSSNERSAEGESAGELGQGCPGEADVLSVPSRPNGAVQPAPDLAGAVHRTWPFVAMAVGAVALEPFTGGRLDAGWWWVGILVAAVGILAGAAAVAGRVRADWVLFGGLLSLVGIVVVRHASHVSGGFGPMVLLPIVWFSLFGSRRQLVAVISCAAVALIAPLVLIGGERYPTTVWRSSLVLIGVGLLAGLSSQRLRDRLATRTNEAGSLAAQLHDALEAMADPVARYEVIRDDAGLPVDLRCVLLNAAGRQMMGDETVGELLSERLLKRGRLEMLDIWLSAVDSAEPVRYELTSQGGRTAESSSYSSYGSTMACSPPGATSPTSVPPNSVCVSRSNVGTPWPTRPPTSRSSSITTSRSSMSRRPSLTCSGSTRRPRSARTHLGSFIQTIDHLFTPR